MGNPKNKEISVLSKKVDDLKERKRLLDIMSKLSSSIFSGGLAELLKELISRDLSETNGQLELLKDIK